MKKHFLLKIASFFILSFIAKQHTKLRLDVNEAELFVFLKQSQSCNRKSVK